VQTPISPRLPAPRWALALALSAAVLAGAGCGGGSKSSSTTAPAATTTSTSSTPSQLTVPGAVTNSAQVQRAVAACHSLVKATPTLTAQSRTKIEGICDKAAHGDIAGARAAAKEACTEIVNGTAGAIGALKAAALARCNAIK
jgi:hypothetical protein